MKYVDFILLFFSISINGSILNNPSSVSISCVIIIFVFSFSSSLNILFIFLFNKSILLFNSITEYFLFLSNIFRIFFFIKFFIIF